MNHTKKYLVVPYVQNLEKPSESYLENLNKNMSDIIQDKHLAADEKIKFYSKNLNNFLLKYDPDSFGVAPTLTKLAEIVTRFIENNNNPIVVEKDLTNLFENNINSSQNFENPRMTNNSSPINLSLPSSSSNSSRQEPTNSLRNTLSVTNLDESNNNNVNEDFLEFSKDLNSDSFGFPQATRVTANLRSKGPATHAEGIAANTRSLKLPSNVTLPSPINKNTNFVNQEPRNKGNRHKPNTSKGSNGRKQFGTGIMWKTKRFF